MQQHFRPASPDAAREIITAVAARQTAVVYFNKRTNGRDRRMVCRYFPEGAERTRFSFNPAERDLLPVWDMEKGARRFISLDRVEEVTWNEPDGPAETAPAATADRPATRREAREQSFEDLRREMHDLF